MSRISQKSKIGLLISLIFLQTALAAWLVHKQPNQVNLGYLVKSKNEFIVAWKGNYSTYQYLSFGSLQDALNFARKDLGLKTATNPVRDLELEHVWLEDRFGAFSLLWKTTKLNFLHQLTFQNERVAEYFAQAFRQGAYAPSPFGHSILLLPEAR